MGTFSDRFTFGEDDGSYDPVVADADGNLSRLLGDGSVSSIPAASTPFIPEAASFYWTHAIEVPSGDQGGWYSNTDFNHGVDDTHNVTLGPGAWEDPGNGAYTLPTAPSWLSFPVDQVNTVQIDAAGLYLMSFTAYASLTDGTSALVMWDFQRWSDGLSMTWLGGSAPPQNLALAGATPQPKGATHVTVPIHVAETVDPLYQPIHTVMAAGDALYPYHYVGVWGAAGAQVINLRVDMTLTRLSDSVTLSLVGTP